MTNNQATYIKNYNKENYKMYQFRVKKSERGLIERLDSIQNRNGYIVNLLLDSFSPRVLTIKQIKDKIRPVMAKHKIEEVYLFGSYARGEANGESDVDIYCSHGDVRTLANEADFIEELQSALNKKVDVVTIGSQMHDFFRHQLEEDAIKLW
ncbi:MAG: nucleotidyltransferase domain-containing protein [Bacilli bacterium]|nr:nucleotidyltransferase domain-containing protein [Bacilli bacterium]